MTDNKARRTRIKNNIRQLIIKKVMEDGEPMIKVARELQLNKQSVSTIIRNYKINGRIDILPKRGCPKKIITLEIGNYIEKQVNFIMYYELLKLI